MKYTRTEQGVFLSRPNRFTAWAEVTRAVKAVTTKPVIIKLTPNVTDITEIALACQEAGAALEPARPLAERLGKGRGLLVVKHRTVAVADFLPVNDVIGGKFNILG